MVFHARRILVTDIGNDENDHLRFDRPDRRTYTVYSHAFLQKSKIQPFLLRDYGRLRPYPCQVSKTELACQI